MALKCSTCKSAFDNPYQGFSLSLGLEEESGCEDTLFTTPLPVPGSNKGSVVEQAQIYSILDFPLN